VGEASKRDARQIGVVCRSAPGQWTKVKIQVAGQTARLYVNGTEQPTLIVNDLKQSLTGGGIALWVGPGTIAHFTDLKITS
jgi:hypothetical protein